jgi:hypothetical protein
MPSNVSFNDRVEEIEAEEGAVEEEEEQTTTTTTTTTFALPSDHSYLEESHPLLPDDPSFYRHLLKKRPRSSSSTSLQHGNDDNQSNNNNGNNNNTNSILELAVLELEGVVLFPGTTIPIKLRDKRLIRYLGPKIQLCRTNPTVQPFVELGILTYEERSNVADAAEQYNDDLSLIYQNRNHRRERQERRRLLRRYMQMMMSDHFGFESASDDSGDDDDDDDNDDNGDANNDDESDNQQEQQQAPQPPPRQRQPPQPQQRPRHPLIGKIGTIATIRQTHERTDLTATNTTTSTATNTQRNNNNNNESRPSEVWGRYADANELVFTAMGTSRFRIVDCVDDDDGQWRRNGSNIFIVEELIDEPIPSPSLFQRPFSSGLSSLQQKETNTEVTTNDTDEEEGSAMITTAYHRQNKTHQFAWCMSQLTPTPYFVYEKTSPWCLVDKMVTSLQTNQGHNNLPSFGTGRSDDSIDRKNLERKF